jgi:hypothetical protein
MIDGASDYVEAGCPRIITMETVTAAYLISRVYLHNPVGGNLHIVLDDYNMDDEDINWCLDRIVNGGSDPSVEMNGRSLDQLFAEENCAEALLKLTGPERWSALAIYEGELLLNGSLDPHVASRLRAAEESV